VETDHLSFRKLALDSKSIPRVQPLRKFRIDTAPAKAEERKVGDGYDRKDTGLIPSLFKLSE
jgi:hypothetical protein